MFGGSVDNNVCMYGCDFVMNVCFVLQDECSYVSLRDIERFIIVYKWFLEMHEELSNVKWNTNVRS